MVYYLSYANKFGKFSSHFLKTTFFVVLILDFLRYGSSPSFRTVWTWWWRLVGSATASTSSSTRYSQLRSASQKSTVNTFAGIGCPRNKQNKFRFEPKQTEDLFRLRFSLFREIKNKKFLFVSVQSKHRNSLFRYRSESTETIVFFRIVLKLVSVPVSVVSNRN